MSTTVHAHRCEACLKSGKQVYWIHSDDCKGVLQAHKCPECGAVEWRKALIEPAKMPQKPQAPQPNKVDEILGYAVLLIAVAMLGYVAYLYYQKKMQPKKEEPK